MDARHGLSTLSWTTDAVQPRHALDYWVATVCDHLLEMRIDSPSRSSFSGSLTTSALGNCGLSVVEAEGQDITRTPELIARSRFSDYRLLHFRWGGGRVSQYDRCVDVATGDCVLLDAAEPYSLRFPASTSCTILTLPRHWLRTWLPVPEQLLARKIPVETGWGATLSAALKCLKPGAPELGHVPGSAIADQVASLLVMASLALDGQARPGRDPLLDRLLASLRERCHDADLDPETLAREHGISKRYLHMVFARAGVTFGESLMTMRLELAHRLLADPRYGALPIGEISARCGFSEPSHFSRRFRDRYGVSPKIFRQGSPDA